jgi:hypothetical protein
MEALHPAPVETWRTDHRDSENRDQMREPSEMHGMWKRAVERLAEELQIEPIAAHSLLRDACHEVTIGQAWAWWD